MTVTITVVNSRRQCKKVIRQTANSEEYGIITNVKMQRLGLRVWHLQFDVDAK